MLDLDAIRKHNAIQPDGYWKTTTAALCDEVERLKRLRDAAFAWADAIERCDGIVAAEEALREVVKELRS